MFSERLENLIKSSLQDGLLTEQEKAAIIKRAQAEGEDIDEVDIYIQSLMQKRQQELEKHASSAAAEEKKKRKEAEDAAIQAEKERNKNLRKCPRCAEYIPALKNICPYCGQVISTAETTAEIQDMISYLDTAFAKLEHCREWHEGELSGSKESLNALVKKGYADTVKSLTYSDGEIRYWINYKYFAIKSKLKNLYGEEPTVKEYLEKKHREECFIKLGHTIDSQSSAEYLNPARRELEMNYSDLNIQPLIEKIDKKLKNDALTNKLIIGAIILFFLIYILFCFFA